MKKFLIAALSLALVFSITVNAGSKTSGKRSYIVGFYNLENLFDTYHDDGKNDYEFLPDGANQWTEAKYQKKLHNMASVIRAMADDNGKYHTILGISEIENRHVIEDLVSQPEIADANYQIVHYDGPDRRGVDVALLYKPEQFKLLESRSIPYTFDSPDIEFDMDEASQERFRTRDILMVRGEIAGEMCAFFVAHLPSRIGGKGSDLRSRGAQIIHEETVRLEAEFPGIKVVAMGDMNDNPTDESMTTYIHGHEDIADVTPGEFFSPFLSMFKAGYGSLAYQGVWSLFDIIVVNDALAHGSKDELQIMPINKKGYYGRVFHKPFMTNQSGQYKDTPFRTFSGGAFIGGYSDHYPTYIVISK